jgi:hypothetical protein
VTDTEHTELKPTDLRVAEALERIADALEVLSSCTYKERNGSRMIDVFVQGSVGIDGCVSVENDPA